METFYQIENTGFSDIVPTLFSSNKYETGFSKEISSLDQYLMIFILNGSADFKNEHSHYFLKKDQGILLFPKQTFALTVIGNEPFRIITCGFFGQRVSQYLNKTTLSPENPLFSIPNTKNLMHYFLVQSNEPFGTNFATISLILYAFSRVYKTDDSSKNTIFSKAISYINSNIDKPIKVLDLAEYLNISRVYLFKIFDNIMGISPKEYILNQKMLLAYESLKNAEISVADIASSIGYHDQFAFSKAFKSKFFISPKDVTKGKIPFIYVLNDENEEYIWPAEITTDRSIKGEHSLLARPYLNKKQNIIEGWLLRAGYFGAKVLPRNLDISALTNYGKKGALTFWIFIERQFEITNWCIDEKDWIRFGSSTDWDTDFQYWFDWHKQIVKEGWNKIVLPFGVSKWGNVCGTPNYNSFNSFGMMLSIPNNLRVFIDDIKVVSEY